jgi:hypothetical protein
MTAPIVAAATAATIAHGVSGAVPVAGSAATS